MKIFVLSPNVDTLFSKSQRESLTKAGDVVFLKEIKPLKDMSELYEGSDERVVAIDPDLTDWQFPNDVIDAIPNLKCICLQTTGHNWIDSAYAAKKGVPVVHLKGFSSIAVAEWALFMTLAVARRLPVVIADQWKLDYRKHRGFELRGKTAGVVGMGNIGKAIAENMSGLGMEVQYWSRKSRDDRFRYVELADVVKTSDVLLFAIATDETTKSLVTNDMLGSMKPGAVLVRVVDAVFDEGYLLDMVQSGKIGGYAYEDEKGPFGKHAGNVWNGPALGWCTDESMSKNGEQWVESMVLAAQGEYPTRVN